MDFNTFIEKGGMFEPEETEKAASNLGMKPTQYVKYVFSMAFSILDEWRGDKPKHIPIKELPKRRQLRKTKRRVHS
ncbi:DNA topoisomerase [Caenorhabditis elegans]|uniref:DNA topoisomerase n=1 Tax=Caenorhabditis elegans TaxID=6239 RepID=F8Y422_CAEEL|nr:DNA topoisomerase [Caenorhabditis elegans]CCD73632.1 DNA topoisomerase [Caenorhabditis elegans]|eukprot:NP_001254014.1 Uncharacterized protein CELE_W04H10.5 [Caenorhabditis elegans]